VCSLLIDSFTPLTNTPFPYPASSLSIGTPFHAPFPYDYLSFNATLRLL
jgi:hypothetical protein